MSFQIANIFSVDIMCNTQYNIINNMTEVTMLRREEILAGFLQEMRRGTIILCVLAKLKQSAYGYNLIGALSETGIPIEANTLYPLLRRLESQGLLESTWNTTDGAKPRKYYATTALGKEVLAELEKHWKEAVQNMNEILDFSEIKDHDFNKSL